MSLDQFNTNIPQGKYDDTPTSVLQQLKGDPFTVVKVEAGIGKNSGQPFCIVHTDKEYNAGVPVETPDGEKQKYETKKCSKFFVTVREPKIFFSNPENIKKINGDEETKGIPCGPVTMVNLPFTAEQIKENSKLKNKSHYILKDSQ